MPWKQWLRTLLGVAALAGILEMLLPAGPLGKFAKLVLGLTLLLAILQPLQLLLESSSLLPAVALPLDFSEPEIRLQGEKVLLAGITPLLEHDQKKAVRETEALLLGSVEIEQAKVEIDRSGPELSVRVRIQPFTLGTQAEVKRVLAVFFNLDQQQISVQEL